MLPRTVSPERRVESGAIDYSVSAGAAARMQFGPVALDLGLIAGRDGVGSGRANGGVLPWVSTAVRL